jgi:hypothetical protein
MVGVGHGVRSTKYRYVVRFLGFGGFAGDSREYGVPLTTMLLLLVMKGFNVRNTMYYVVILLSCQEASSDKNDKEFPRRLGCEVINEYY